MSIKGGVSIRGGGYGKGSIKFQFLENLLNFFLLQKIYRRKNEPFFKKKNKLHGHTFQGTNPNILQPPSKSKVGKRHFFKKNTQFFLKNNNKDKPMFLLKKR